MSDKIYGAFFISSTGLAIPVFDMKFYTALYDSRSLGALVKKHGRSIQTIMGNKPSVEAVELMLARSNTVGIDYYLMVAHGTHEACIDSPPNLSIKQASIEDTGGLIPLQRDYEKEEVLLNPDRYEPATTHAILRRSLKTQLVYMAQLDGKTVAKAGTNARGLNYDQIGGVFTVKAYRNRGIAAALMNVLLRKIDGMGKKACLFVKTGNSAALKLYENVGFQIIGRFRIAYVTPS